MSEIYSRQPQACECHAISQQSYHRAKRHLRPTRGQKERRGKREGAGERLTKAMAECRAASKNLIIIKYFIVRLTIQLFHLTAPDRKDRDSGREGVGKAA